MKLKERYKINKESKVGDKLICPSCGSEFKKTNYQQVFCKTKTGTKCKDKYWNTVTPHKRNNTTRISPASAAFMVQREVEKTTIHSVYDDFHPFEGLNDDDYKTF
jgi:hypothetical protein